LKTFTALAVVLIQIAALNINAQGSCDMSAVVPLSNIAPKPIGFSLNVLSPSVIGPNSRGKKLPPEFGLRFGAGFYLANLDSKKVDNVPLLKPDLGLAKVGAASRIFGLNIITRLEFHPSKIVVPYLDLFYGLRENYVHLDIIPYDKQQRTGSQYAGSFVGTNYGTTVGLKFRLAKDCYADIGLVYSNTTNQGMMADIHTARVEGKDLVMDHKNAPPEMFMIKTGFVFNFVGSNGNHSCHHYYHHSGCHIGGGGSHVSVHIK
jgi:hypothetical protein